MMLSTKQALLHRVTLERGTLLYAIGLMPEEELVRRPLVGEWSAKDILGHIESWEAEIMRGIEQFMRGERPALFDIIDDDAWNAQQATSKWDASLSDVQEQMFRTRRRLLDMVTNLPDEAFVRPGPAPSLRPFIPAILNTIADHDREHWSALMACKEKWAAAQQVEVQSVA
jgi:hypothetical protein